MIIFLFSKSIAYAVETISFWAILQAEVFHSKVCLTNLCAVLKYAIALTPACRTGGPLFDN